jgi:hypothetical protein
LNKYGGGLLQFAHAHHLTAKQHASVAEHITLSQLTQHDRPLNENEMLMLVYNFYTEYTKTKSESPDANFWWLFCVRPDLRALSLEIIIMEGELGD